MALKYPLTFFTGSVSHQRSPRGNWEPCLPVLVQRDHSENETSKCRGQLSLSPSLPRHRYIAGSVQALFVQHGCTRAITPRRDIQVHRTPLRTHWRSAGSRTTSLSTQRTMCSHRAVMWGTTRQEFTNSVPMWLQARTSTFPILTDIDTFTRHRHCATTFADSHEGPVR